MILAGASAQRPYSVRTASARTLRSRERPYERHRQRPYGRPGLLAIALAGVRINQWLEVDKEIIKKPLVFLASCDSDGPKPLVLLVFVFF